MDLQRLQADVASFFTSAPAAQVLCRLTNPEKVLRGELLGHLRSCGWNAVQEMAHHKNGLKRYLDIVTFHATSTTPLCVIEIMHHSAHRGGTWTLTAGMDSDFHMFRPAAPLMHIGLYTVIHGLARYTAPVGAEDGACFAAALADWSAARQWNGDVTIARTDAQRFHHDGLGSVEGHLEFFIGVRKSGAPAVA